MIFEQSYQHGQNVKAYPQDMSAPDTKLGSDDVGTSHAPDGAMHLQHVVRRCCSEL